MTRHVTPQMTRHVTPQMTRHVTPQMTRHVTPQITRWTSILPPILFFSHIPSYISHQIPPTMSDNISIPAANSAIANNTEPSPEFIEFARKLWEAQQQQALAQEAARSQVCMLCFPFTVAFLSPLLSFHRCFPFTVAFHSQCLSVLTTMMFY
jgi:hypothetical protein